MIDNVEIERIKTAAVLDTLGRFALPIAQKAVQRFALPLMGGVVGGAYSGLNAALTPIPAAQTEMRMGPYGAYPVQVQDAGPSILGSAARGFLTGAGTVGAAMLARRGLRALGLGNKARLLNIAGSRAIQGNVLPSGALSPETVQAFRATRPLQGGAGFAGSALPAASPLYFNVGPMPVRPGAGVVLTPNT